MKGEPVRREEKQFSLMIQQALLGVPVCPLSGTWARWQHRVTGTITRASGLPKGALPPQGLVARGPAKALQRRVLQPLEERVGSSLRASIGNSSPQPSSAAPSPLLLGPSGISRSLPWPNRADALGSSGGRGLGSGPGSPSLYFPLPLSAVRVKLGL